MLALPELNTGLLGVIAYVPTLAVAAVPGLVSVTLLMASVPCNPEDVNSVPLNVSKDPYVLLASLAVIARITPAAVMSAVNPVGCISR